MSSLEKLAIRGIRSFSPQDEQTIEFYSPLTMIVGQNGSGKTTIIECLKYACTGKLPPGGASTAGQSWVHDPKLTDDAEVKASIKLRFRTQNDRRLVVIRSLQLQYKGKNKTPTFKQLEGVVRNVNPVTKKAESLSHKCQDLNNFVPTATGISAAILESVVFCHQEESSWPLQDGATLKKKFDDIFEATRYTKALDAIEKCRKLRAEEHKNLRIELAALTENREASMVLLRELEAKTQEIQEVQAKLAGIEERIETLASKRLAAQEQLQEQEAAAKQLETRVLLLEERGRSLEEKKRSLGQEELPGSDAELRARLESFAKDQETQQRELNRLRQKEAGFRKEGETARAEIGRLTGEKGELKAKMEQLARMVEERNREIQALCEKYTLNLPPSLAAGASETATAASASAAAAGNDASVTVALGDAELKRFLFDLHGKKEELSNGLKHFRAEKTKRLEGPRAKVIELEAKLRANEAGRADKEAEAQEIEKRLQATTQEMMKHQVVAPTMLEGLRAEAKKERETVEVMQKGGEDRALEKEISELGKELDQLSVDLGREEKLLDDLRANDKERTLRDKLAGDVAVKQANVKGMAARFSGEASFAALVAEMQATQGGGGAVESLDDVQTAHAAATSKRAKLQGDGERTARQLLERRKQLTALQTNLARDRQDLEGLEKEIAELDRAGQRHKVNSLLDEAMAIHKEVASKKDPPLALVKDDVEASLPKLQEFYTKTHGDGLTWGIQAAFYKKYKALAEGANACPCCDRAFDEDTADLEEFMTKQAEEAENADAKGNLRLAKAVDIKRIITNLEQMAAGIKALAPLRAKQEAAQAKVDKAQAEAEQLSVQVAQMEAEGKAAAEKAQALGRMIAELEKLSAAFNELRALEADLATKDRHIELYGTADAEGRTIDAVDEKVKEMRKTQADKREAVDNARKKQQQHNRNLLRQAALARAAEEKLEEQLRAVSRSQELQKEQEQLKARQEEVRAAAAAAAEEEMPMKQALRQAQADFDVLKGEIDAEDADLQRKRIECSQVCQNFEALQQKLQQMEGQGASKDLAELEKDMRKAERAVGDAEDKAQALRPTMHGIAQALQDQDRVRRQIEDNLAYRRMLADKEREEAELAALQERMAASEDRDRLIRAVNSLDRQWREAREEKARNEATVDTLTAVQQEQQDKLKSSKYHKVEKRYREAKIKCDTTQMAVEDLHKYHKALDRALMRYHKMKIEEINKIIRELWTRTYQGNDIEEIAIVSGEDAPGGGRATRSYNYRVVMKKGQTLLDMRGRCSAGQRVLASIVIRLALAETFCINCGVMTLDEPTTNLDHDNKGGLARAIARLIAERSKQQNFQLVVITHDEDFVDMVKQEMSTQTGFSMPEHYWRISRQAAGGGRAYSKIEQVEWGGL